MTDEIKNKKWAEYFLKSLPQVRKDIPIFKGGIYGKHAGQFQRSALNFEYFIQDLIDQPIIVPQGVEFEEKLNEAEKAAEKGDFAAFVKCWK